MGKRSRKPPPGQGEPKKRLTGAERDEIARAGLTPLEPGERPATLVVAVAVAAIYGLASVALAALGVGVAGSEPSLRASIFFCVLMLVAAAGMWFQRYWAAIGFQAFLAIVLVLVALSILKSSSVVSTLISILILALGGWLFWKMVRVLGRMRVPRPGDDARPQ